MRRAQDRPAAQLCARPRCSARGGGAACKREGAWSHNTWQRTLAVTAHQVTHVENEVGRVGRQVLQGGARVAGVTLRRKQHRALGPAAAITTEAAPCGHAPLQSFLIVGTILSQECCCRALTRSPNTPMRMGLTFPTSGRVLKLLSGDLRRGDRQDIM
jgi:hypothetical protein